MNDNLLQISLNQGKHFKKNFSKIKELKELKELKEGFVSLEKQQEHIIRPSYKGYVPVLQNMKQDANLTRNMNQTDLNEVKQAQQKYNDLLQQYTAMQQKIGNSSLNAVNRLSSNNPYLNKTIRFSSGHICYVTNQGVVKWVPSMDIWNSTNVPKNYTDINLPWLNSYNTPGTTIPTEPTLITGTPLKMGESIGNEGSNVYVNSLLSNNISPTYVGCYASSPNNDNMTFIGNIPSSKVSIINGNFEQPAIGKNSYIYITDNNNRVLGWNFNAILLNNSNAWGYSMPYPNGNQCVSIQMKSTISQDIVLQANNNYVLSFYCCARGGGGNQVKINLYDKDTLLLNITDLNYQENKWKYYSIGFKVSSTKTYTLFFSGQSDRDQSTAFQGISINNDNDVQINNGTFTYEDCKTSAIENGYKYFAIQNVNETTSKGYCAVSNDEPSVTRFGDASVQRISISLWASNTSSDYNSYVQLAGDGSLTVSDSSKRLFTTGGVKGCESWGTLTVQSATYGGNCKAPIGNVTEKVGKLGCNWVESCSIPISNSTFGDPVPGCGKGFDIAYSCGSTPFSKHLNYAEGQTMIMNECKAYMADKCQFYLILQDDGNMCIYRGKSPSTTGEQVWSTNTNGQQKATNPDWVASKGPYKRNYITTGQSLGTDQWIGSNNGSLKLIMQKDGNLVLYTSGIKSGCKVINNKTYGGELINAVYNIGETAIPQNMGLVGYIDSESKLMLYPDSMLETTNNYQIFKDSDSGGNDISYLNVKDQNECQTACNNNADCRAYQFNGNNCWLKNKNAYPKSGKAYATGATLGVRLPGVKGSKTCSNKIVNVDTIQFDNYIFGAEMTPNTQCNSSIVSREDQLAFDNIKSQLIMLGDEIASKTEHLYNEDNKIFEKLNMNEEQFKKSIENYKLTNIKIKKELNLKDNNIEGMQNNNDNDNNMYNINGILTDSDLRVLQENYSYIMWSIFAIGALTITINTLKK